MIERLGIDVHFQKLHIGTEMLIFIKACFLDLLIKLDVGLSYNKLKNIKFY